MVPCSAGVSSKGKSQLGQDQPLCNPTTAAAGAGGFCGLLGAAGGCSLSSHFSGERH